MAVSSILLSNNVMPQLRFSQAQPIQLGCNQAPVQPVFEKQNDMFIFACQMRDLTLHAFNYV